MSKKGEKAWGPAVQRYLKESTGRGVSVKEIISETKMIGNDGKAKKRLCASPICPMPNQLARFLTTKKDVVGWEASQWGRLYFWIGE